MMGQFVYCQGHESGASSLTLLPRVCPRANNYHTASVGTCEVINPVSNPSPFLHNSVED